MWNPTPGSGCGIPLCVTATVVHEDPLAMEEGTPLGFTRPWPMGDVPRVGSQENLAVGSWEILAVDSQEDLAVDSQEKDLAVVF